MTDFTTSETFNSAWILEAALTAIEANISDDNFEVHVATEFDRKGELNHRPLDNPNLSYSSSSDDLIVSIMLRIPSYSHKKESVMGLTDAVNTELANRKNIERMSKIAERETKIAELEAELAELRK